MRHSANKKTAETNAAPLAVPDFAASSEAAGHHSGAADEIEGAGASHHLEAPELIRIGFVGLAIIALWLRPWESYPHFGAIGFIVALIGGYLRSPALDYIESYVTAPALGERAGVLGAIALARDAGVARAPRAGALSGLARRPAAG